VLKVWDHWSAGLLMTWQVTARRAPEPGWHMCQAVVTQAPGGCRIASQAPWHVTFACHSVLAVAKEDSGLQGDSSL
jgi:hypothetical protein